MSNNQKKLSNNKQSGSVTTKRQWQMLSELQRKRWTGTKSLQKKLSQAGFDVSIRTIQRDLNQLAQQFPIESNGENPQGWRWTEDSPQQNLPQMSISEAIAFHLVESNLRQILPQSFLAEMQPWFQLARSQLQVTQKTGAWLDSIRIIPATQPLIGAPILADIQNTIYEALMQGKQLKASYQKTEAVNTSDNLTLYNLHPLALIQRGVVLYLIATKVDEEDKGIRMFALHRFHKCTLSNKDRIIPATFNIDKFLDDGELGFKYPNLETKTTKIQLTFAPHKGKNLLENKLNLDHEAIVDEVTGQLIVTATVTTTAQLVWWLRGYGKDLFKIEPPELAQAVWEG